MNNDFRSEINSSFQNELPMRSSPSFSVSDTVLLPQDQQIQFNQPVQFIQPQQQRQLPTEMSKSSVTEQHLWDLANVYYSHAKLNQSKIETKKNLLEYYSLVQLSIISLKKIIDLGSTATLRLKVKANLKIAEIFMNESSDPATFDTEDNQPEYYLDQVILLTNQNIDYINYTVHASFLIIQQLLNRNQYKQAIKLLNDQNGYFQALPLFKYLRFQALSHLDSSRALALIQSFINSYEFLLLNNDTRLFFLLIESGFALEKGYQSIVRLDGLPGSSILQLEVLKQFLGVLYEISAMNEIRVPKGSNQLPTLNSRLKTLGTLLTNNSEQLYQMAFMLSFPVLNNVEVPVWIPWINYPIMNIFFYLLYGISKLHMTFDKRDSLKTFKQCLSLIDAELQKYSPLTSDIKSNHEQLSKLKQLKRTTFFFIIIENSASQKIDSQTLQDYIREISPSTDTTNTIFLKALKYQQQGDLKLAKEQYYSVIQYFEPKHDANYNDLYIISHLNLLAIIESELSYSARTSNTVKYSVLNQERTNLLAQIRTIQSSKNTSFQSKYLLDITLSFLQILYNYTSSTTIGQNTEVSSILDPNFENLKKFTMLGSSFLYLKSSTLNQNSDQKQKSSQLSFNLAKMGYMPLVRYVSGLLNGNNAKVAGNLQQHEIQRQKLEKIEKNLDQKYRHMFE